MTKNAFQRTRAECVFDFDQIYIQVHPCILMNLIKGEIEVRHIFAPIN